MSTTLPSAVFELSTVNTLKKADAQKTIEAQYPHGLTYRGMEFFDSVYMNRIVPQAEDVLGLTHETGQESYLGYLPSQDIFISAYDTWETETEGRPYGIARVKVTDQVTKAEPDTVMYNRDDMVYGKQGAYAKLHAKYPDLIDIRLD